MTLSTNTPRQNRLQKRSPIRQTVLNGPRTNNLADFLEVGTGLEVVSKGVDANNPLTVSMGLGFDSRGFQLDETQVIETPFAIGSLPDDEAKVYLYAQFDANNNVSYGFTLLEPLYLDDEPSAPATGQYWYPRQHNSVGKVYNGASFDDVKRIYLGECTTAAGVVTEVISEQFQIGLRVPYGIEFFSGEYSDGKPVYEYRNEVATDITADVTIETIASGLKPVESTNFTTTQWSVRKVTTNGSGPEKADIDYDSSNGNIKALLNNWKLGAGTVYKLKYTK